MPHQCVRCNTFYDDGSNVILKGCSCGGRLFSSLQDFVRLVLTKLAHHELTVEVVPAEYIKLSPAAKKRYAKMTEDFKKGRNIYQAKDVDDLLRQLNS